MARTITYCLKEDASNSDKYFSDIKAFADTWLAQIRDSIYDLVAIFNQDRLYRGMPIRSLESSAFDLLSLGVVLREHGAELDQMPGWCNRLLVWLIDVQEHNPQWQPSINSARGLVNRLAHMGKKASSQVTSLDMLQNWLVAIGGNTKAERFQEWIACYKRMGKEKALNDRCQRLADEFDKLSLEALGKYTEQVEGFLAHDVNLHRWRYDAYLLNSTRLEYHLGMLGNEILNREYRQSFTSCPRKVVLLPPCMRAQPETECKAIATRLGEQCASCTPSCHIHQVTKLGEKYGFDVFMIPEELRIFRSESNGNVGMGVIGVSCVLTNWSGGWDAESIGLPAQGLLLDYVGCKYHWDTRGFPTDVNLRKLLEILSLN